MVGGILTSSPLNEITINRMKRLFPHEILETFRSTLRIKKRLEKYESFQELVTKIGIEGKPALIASFVNIEWDFVGKRDALRDVGEN